jgi:hypothetical protein
LKKKKGSLIQDDIDMFQLQIHENNKHLAEREIGKDFLAK